VFKPYYCQKKKKKAMILSLWQKENQCHAPSKTGIEK
jgi:hypothetical protein